MNLEEVKKKVNQLYYLLTTEEVETLFSYASKVPDGGNIVDIGTCAGGSAFTMALASNAHVYTIDPISNEGFLHKIIEWEMQDKITYFNKTSEEAITDLEGVEIDLIFIDGIHSYNGVTNDFTWYAPMIKSGATVIFHDYFLYRDTIGKAIDDLVESGKIEKIEIIDSLYHNEKRTGMFIARKV